MAGKFVKVARAEDIAPGTSIAVELPEASLAISNVDGQFFAIENLCTHDDGPLGEGELYGFRIQCPRHLAYFDVRNGKALTLPAVMDVECFPVRVEDGDLVVEL